MTSDVGTAKPDHEGSFGEEGRDIITEIVESTRYSHVSFGFSHLFQGMKQLSRKLSTRIRHPQVPNPPDTDCISVNFPSMTVVMISVIRSRRQLLPSSSFIPLLVISWMMSQTRNWMFRTNHYTLLLVLWQVRPPYMREKNSGSPLSSLILPQLSPRA